MEIKDFLSVIQRGVLILIFGVVLGAAVGLAAGVLERPVYEATTQVLVSRPRLPSDTDVLPLSEDQLVITNALLVKTKPVRDAAAAALGGKVSAAAIQVTALSNSLIIEITVQDTDATRAAAIANSW